MASIGIDFGNSFCCVATCQDGKVEVISNEHDKRLTPSYVAFTEDERLFGEAAQHQAPLNLENTIYQIKRVVGRTGKDQALRHHQQNWGFHVDLNNQLEIPITFREKEYTLRPEQITAMMLEKMKQIAEEYLRTEVENVVISIPACFNKSQHDALRAAGIIAGFQNIKLLKEPNAAALTFARNRNQSTKHHILIFDIGGGKFDAAIYNIENGNATERLAEYGDPNFGGDDFDHNMMNHILDQQRNISRDNKKGMFRLKAACEKAKKTLSQTTRARLQADCLNGNEPYTTTLMRTQFEEMNVNEFNSIEPILHELLERAKLEPGEIDDIVLVGGSSRIPKIREILQKVFQGKLLNKTINPDEAVACGCAFWAEQAFASVENKPKIWPEEIQEMIEQNAIFNRGDEELREQSEARNALENTVYDMRQKIINNQDEFNENQLEKLQKECDGVISWLRGKGQNASVEKIKRKKSSLKKAFKRERERQKQKDDQQDDSADPGPKRQKLTNDQQNPSAQFKLMTGNGGDEFHQLVENNPTQHSQTHSTYEDEREPSTESQSVRNNWFLQQDDKRKLLQGDDRETPGTKYSTSVHGSKRSRYEDAEFYETDENVRQSRTLPSPSGYNEGRESTKKSGERSHSNRMPRQDDRQGLLHDDQHRNASLPEYKAPPVQSHSTYKEEREQSRKSRKNVRKSLVSEDQQELLGEEGDINATIIPENNANKNSRESSRSSRGSSRNRGGASQHKDETQTRREINSEIERRGKKNNRDDDASSSGKSVQHALGVDSYVSEEASQYQEIGEEEALLDKNAKKKSQKNLAHNKEKYDKGEESKPDVKHKAGTWNQTSAIIKQPSNLPNRSTRGEDTDITYNMKSESQQSDDDDSCWSCILEWFGWCPCSRPRCIDEFTDSMA